MPSGVSFTDYGVLGGMLTLSLGVIVYLWRTLIAQIERFVAYLQERAAKDHDADIARSAATAQLASTLGRLEERLAQHEDAALARHRELMEFLCDGFRDMSAAVRNQGGRER